MGNCSMLLFVTFHFSMLCIFQLKLSSIFLSNCLLYHSLHAIIQSILGKSDLKTNLLAVTFVCPLQVRDSSQEPCGRLSFLRETKTSKGLTQAAICNLNITLPGLKKVRLNYNHLRHIMPSSYSGKIEQCS